jgi:ABC-type glycerol-3-phosphate transport system substrate-binding protein
MVLSLVACGKKDEASVYYLNFKPEADTAWQQLADEYTKATGIPVKVVTAASGTYEDTLVSEMDVTGRYVEIRVISYGWCFMGEIKIK